MRILPSGRRDWIRLSVLGASLLSLTSCGYWATMGFEASRGDEWDGLPTPAEEAIRPRLEAHVRMLSETIGERHLEGRANALAAAAAHIRDGLAAAGLVSRAIPFPANGLEAENVEAVRLGAGGLSGEIVVGAHYDTVPGTPGADDNATGVAALLEIARLLPAKALRRTIRFVAFANEEPPYFLTEAMGSMAYARRLQANAVNVAAMLSLESLGRYSDVDGSQDYPFPLGLRYPSRGNFVAFVGNVGSRALVDRCLAAFRKRVSFPAEGAALPEFLPGAAWSDHASFWKAGFPALMATDTATFRTKDYHTGLDRIDRLDFPRFARVVLGLAGVVETLADEG